MFIFYQTVFKYAKGYSTVKANNGLLAKYFYCTQLNQTRF